MSWHKRTLFWKCSNLEAKNIINFKLCHKRDERSNYNLRLTKSRRQTFLDGCMHLNIKINEKFQTENKAH